MNELNGMFLFLSVVGLSVCLCLVMWFLHRRKEGKSNDFDELYNRIVLSNILPSNQGVSIDEVMANLSDEDMSGFHLSNQGTEGGSVS